MLSYLVYIDGEPYYRTKSACNQAGISVSTYFRWVRHGIIKDAQKHDRNGRRLFTNEEIDAIKQHSEKIIMTEEV